MKHFLPWLFCLICTISVAQTTWTGAIDTNWSNANNWDTNAVPNATNDVIIPDGFAVTLNNVGSVKSIDIQGNSQFNINTNFAFFEPSTFGINTTVNWSMGSINGNTSNLTNYGTLNLVSPSNKLLVGDIVLNNLGTINIVNGDFLIAFAIINNEASGIIDIQADNSDIALSGGDNTHILNNIGLIKKTSSGNSRITLLLNNTGTITVESGVLTFEGVLHKNLTGGIYNVFSGAVINWESITNLSDELTGTIDGDLNWSFELNVETAATLNFTGSGNVNWTTNQLKGGGTLTNLGTFNLATTGQKIISENTNLNNSGIINFTASGSLFINDGIVNNQIDGIIDMRVDSGHIRWSGSGSHILNNAGLLKRTASSGVVQIYAELNNSGTIEVSSGELEHTGDLPFINEETGIVKGVGIFDVPTTVNHTNNGVFSPGLSPGILTIQGDFISSSTSVLDIEIEGYNQGAEYDLLAIEGDAVIDGMVNITLGFAPSISDEFIIATTTGTITDCSVNPTASTTFNSSEYTFSVTCRNQNEVVLIVIDILGVTDFELASSITLFPNPTSNAIILKKNNAINLQKAVLTDMLGKSISTIDLTTMQEQKQIALNNYAKGIYLLQIHSEGKSITKKIIRQ